MKKIVGLLSAVGALAVTKTAYAVSFYDPSSTLGLGSADLQETVIAIIQWILGLLGLIAVVMILIGGFKWMTAGGNDERVGQAKKWIFSGIIGLAIILSAYALSTWVINTLISATTGTVTTK